MNIKQFIKECNNSPALKKYVPITRKLLSDANFIKKDYEPKDLIGLRDYLFFIPPNVLKKDKLFSKSDSASMLHLELIKIHDNKILIKKYRSELKMTFDNKGFDVLKKIPLDLFKHFTERNYELYNPDYKKWVLGWAEPDDNSTYEYTKIKNGSLIVRNKVFDVVVKIMEKWRLPWRYFDAIEELLIFNNIIPANKSIEWHQSYYNNGKSKQKPKISITFDVNTTKEELIEAIEKDRCLVFKNRKKHFLSKPRKMPRKSLENEKMIAIYNLHKKDGESDERAFKAIKSHPEFNHMSLSAIRDRIKR